MALGGCLTSLILRVLSCKPRVVKVPLSAPGCWRVEAGLSRGWGVGAGGIGCRPEERAGDRLTPVEEKRPSTSALAFEGGRHVPSPGSPVAPLTAGVEHKRVARVDRRWLPLRHRVRKRSCLLCAPRSLLGGDGRPRSEAGTWAETARVQTRLHLQLPVPPAATPGESPAEGCSLETELRKPRASGAPRVQAQVSGHLWAKGFTRQKSGALK